MSSSNQSVHEEKLEGGLAVITKWFPVAQKPPPMHQPQRNVVNVLISVKKNSFISALQSQSLEQIVVGGAPCVRIQIGVPVADLHVDS